MTTQKQKPAVPTVRVAPVVGRKVRIPEAGYLPLSGETEVPRNSFWIRRIERGDVQEVTKSKPKAK